MKAIYPISTEQCRPHYGKPVCIFLKDGTEIFGTLSRLNGGKLILNEEAVAATAKTKASKSAVRSKKGNAAGKAKKSDLTAGTPGYGPNPGFPPFGGAIALDLPMIARVYSLF